MTSLRYLILLPALGPIAYYCLVLVSGWDFLQSLRRRPAFDPTLVPPSVFRNPCKASIVKAIRILRACANWTIRLMRL
jgi:hypothetical protein